MQLSQIYMMMEINNDGNYIFNYHTFTLGTEF